MTELEKYQAVNKIEDFDDFERVLLSFASEDGQIQGRTRVFDAKKMVAQARDYYNNQQQFGENPNIVTREFGLRQQLMYIKYYK